jgi:hypothetical protein
MKLHYDILDLLRDISSASLTSYNITSFEIHNPCLCPLSKLRRSMVTSMIDSTKTFLEFWMVSFEITLFISWLSLDRIIIRHIHFASFWDPSRSPFMKNIDQLSLPNSRSRCDYLCFCHVPDRWNLDLMQTSNRIWLFLAHQISPRPHISRKFGFNWFASGTSEGEKLSLNSFLLRVWANIELMLMKLEVFSKLLFDSIVVN